MGREIKHVSVDFDWPMSRVWDGYINPHYRKCPRNCEGGYSPSYKSVAEHINLLMWSRTNLSDPNVAKITAFLSGREVSGPFGHDSIAAYFAVKKLGELAGLPDDWHTCSHCNGDGIDPSAKDAYEAWEPTEPPAGDGWQVWETVSEGSPVTPVMPTREALVDYLVANGDAWDQKRGDGGWTRESAERFVDSEWAPSMVIIDGQMKTARDGI